MVRHIITDPIPIHRSDAVTPTPNTCEPQSSDLAVGQAAPSTYRVLDVDGLINRCMGNIDLVQRVLEKFQQRIPEELAELENAFELGETERLASNRTSHPRKLGDRIGRGTRASRSGDRRREPRGRVADIPAGIEHLRSEWRRLAELPSDLACRQVTPRKGIPWSAHKNTGGNLGAQYHAHPDRR